MKKFGMPCLFLLALCLIVGCSNSNQDTSERVSSESDNRSVSKVEPSNAKINVSINISTNVGADNTVRVTAETNLPDNMELMLSVRGDSGYFAQDKVTIINGSFMSNTFSNKGSGLDAGTYAVEINSSTANVQPPDVKRIIGGDGANLEGIDVKSDSVWGNTIAVSKKFEISSISTNQYYTKEELENDPEAPSLNPNDYDDAGQYVPENGISDKAEDYNIDGNYRPVEEMSQEEIEAELTEMFEEALGQ
ncbi:hypothetical protein [Paenibacillus sp. MMS18-CY102]|uniref:hypothetical protein n=1 Tax=Paenibacillus sp. MMS18-CY102 TaxID=2682849 RepID=UPI001365CE1B|nr:hypothetical protein [Paenibacillus sp. MMS18-CY102]MWC31355.1 hypothetical protein [Paenibacillus sp. MMS18-CY102]